MRFQEGTSQTLDFPSSQSSKAQSEQTMIRIRWPEIASQIRRQRPNVACMKAATGSSPFGRMRAFMEAGASIFVRVFAIRMVFGIVGTFKP